MRDGFIKVAAVTPDIRVADCEYNAEQISIGRKDLEEMIKDGEPIEMNCHFCNSHYQFSVEELKKILAQAKKR